MTGYQRAGLSAEPGFRACPDCGSASAAPGTADGAPCPSPWHTSLVARAQGRTLAPADLEPAHAASPGPDALVTNRHGERVLGPGTTVHPLHSLCGECAYPVTLAEAAARWTHDDTGRYVLVPESRQPVAWVGPPDGARTAGGMGVGVTLFGTEPPAPVVAVTVAGRVAPQGSKSAFSPCYQDAARCTRCRRAHLVKINQVEKSKYLKAWREAVAAAARQQYDGPLLDGPLSGSMIFSLERPGSHYLHRKAGDVIRPDAPLYPADTPDLSKLLRATEDALTGTVWVDDARVVTYTCLRMVYAQDSPLVPGAPPGPGASIVVTQQA